MRAQHRSLPFLTSPLSSPRLVSPRLSSPPLLRLALPLLLRLPPSPQAADVLRAFFRAVNEHPNVLAVVRRYQQGVRKLQRWWRRWRPVAQARATFLQLLWLEALRGT